MLEACCGSFLLQNTRDGAALGSTGVMESVQINLSRGTRAKRLQSREGRSNSDVNGSLVNYAFNDGEDSEDSSEPRKIPVARLVAAVSADAQKNVGDERPHVEKVSSPLQKAGQSSTVSAVKSSQIARLVARRQKAQGSMIAVGSDKVNDEVMFRYDVNKCADEADMVRYERTPVAGFGESMLRAMGWKGELASEGGASGVDGGIPKRQMPRPARLGLGAKPSADKEAKKRPRSSTQNSANDVVRPNGKIEVSHELDRRHLAERNDGQEEGQEPVRGNKVNATWQRASRRKSEGDPGEDWDLRRRSKKPRFSERKGGQRGYSDTLNRSAYRAERSRDVLERQQFYASHRRSHHQEDRLYREDEESYWDRERRRDEHDNYSPPSRN